MADITGTPSQKCFYDRSGKWTVFRAVLLVLLLLTILFAGAILLFRQRVYISDISFSNDMPVYGQALSVAVVLENKSLIKTEYNSILLINGEPKAIQPVFLEPGKPVSMAFDLSGLPFGAHNLSIGGESAEFTLYRPAAFNITALTVDPETLMVGETAVVRAVITNTGDLEGVFVDQLSRNDQWAALVRCSVLPGESAVHEIQIIMDERGTHWIALSGLSKAVHVQSPADISLSGIRLGKAYASLSEPVVLEALLHNSGDQPGNHTVELLVDGVKKQTQEITLAAGAFGVATFDLTQDTPGKYRVQVGDLQEILQIVTLARPDNGTVLVKDANSGYGQVTLINDDKERDAVFIFSPAKEPGISSLAVYVHADSKVSGVRIKDGSYQVYCTSGNDYDSTSRRFMSTPYYHLYEEPVHFETTQSANATHYSVCTISIQSDDSDVLVLPVHEEDFPRQAD